MRREEAMGVRVPEPILDRADVSDPEHEAVLADSVGLALLVVLENLSPLSGSFVLHDIFAMPFDEIAPIVDRSPEATRQLASRARRRVRGEYAVPDTDLAIHRKVVDAFLVAAREGDFEGLPGGAGPRRRAAGDLGLAGGSREPAAPGRLRARRSSIRGSAQARGRPLVNGALGGVSTKDGEPFAVGGYTIRAGRSSRSTSSPTRSGSGSST